MVASSAARSTSVTKSLRPFALTCTRSMSRLARLMIEPALRAALTAVLSIGCMDGGRANGGGSGGAGWIDWPHFIGKVCVDPNPGFATLAAHVRFILVAPSHPGNIGAAARALKAMGFARLGVVNPRVVDFRTDPEAVALSVGAVDILAAATDHPELVAALGGV